MANRILLRDQEKGFCRKFSNVSDRRHLVYLRPFPAIRHNVTALKKDTIYMYALRVVTNQANCLFGAFDCIKVVFWKYNR